MNSLQLRATARTRDALIRQAIDAAHADGITDIEIVTINRARVPDGTRAQGDSLCDAEPRVPDGTRAQGDSLCDAEPRVPGGTRAQGDSLCYIAASASNRA